MLEDFAAQLYERGLEARDKCNAYDQNSPKGSFYCGIAQAYHEVLDILIHKAESFGVRDEIAGLEKIDPDKLLSLDS